MGFLSDNSSEEFNSSPEELKSGIHNFLEHIWHEIEPIVIEFLTYCLIIFFVALVTFVTKSFVPEKIENTLNNIKYFLIVSVIGLLTVRTIIVVLIRALGSLSKEGRKAFEIEKSNKPDSREKSVDSE
jgi:hypothetical protein